MATNESGKWLYGSPNPPYEVYEGDDHPDGSIVLAAPGGTVPGDYVARYKLEDKLKGDDKKNFVASDGEPIVHLDGGRAVAASMAPEHLRPEGYVNDKSKGYKADAKPKAADADDMEDDPDKPGHKRVKSKMVKPAEAENKAMAGPNAGNPPAGLPHPPK